MPLYIDLHIDKNLTLDVVKQCHVADKAVQEKFGVRYLQILLNQPQGYLFCLVEGPDKESCAKVHQEAHGSIACNILEITQSDFIALLAGKKKDIADFTLNPDGTLDTGNRAILSIGILGTVKNLQLAKEIANGVLKQNAGWRVDSKGYGLTTVFGSCRMAVEAGISIGQKIVESGIAVEVRMGVDMGPPLEERGNFFEYVSRAAGQLSFIASHGMTIIAPKAMQLYDGDAKAAAKELKMISPSEEKFLRQVMACTEKIWDTAGITMVAFARELGMSKSQLDRKLKVLTGFAPNEFIREYRLRKAISLMEDGTMNIAEITMAIGFGNPSYFTKCFRKRFAKSPSDFMATA